MPKIKRTKSVVETFTRNSLLLISASAIVIAVVTSYITYSNFLDDTKSLESEYVVSQKEMLEREVTHVKSIIDFSRSKLDARIKKQIKSRVYEAHALASHLYNQYKDSKTNAEIVTLIKDAIRPLRFFEGRGYIFINSMKGSGILHPPSPQLEGRNILRIKNKQGIHVGEESINLVREKKEGFYQYDWIKPDTSREAKKMSFVKHFEPLDWLIGAGDYIENFEANIKQEVLERIGEIRFGTEGYIFVVNYEGTVMMNRGQPQLIGKNILHVKDPNGIPVAEEVIRLAQTPDWDGYFSYGWNKLSSNIVSPKVAYHKTVPDWGWYYGTGVYMDDVQGEIASRKKVLEEQLITQITIIFITASLAISALFVLAKRSTTRLNNDLEQLLSFFDDHSVDRSALDINNIRFQEFRTIGDSANAMLSKQKESEDQRNKYEQRIRQSQKMDAITQLVGGIAHDFNNLLGVILGYGELLELNSSDQKKNKEYAQQINNAGRRGAKLTRKLLSITHNKQQSESVRTDLNLLLKDEEIFLMKSLTSKINLSLTLQDNLWPVCIDRADFEDAILNLCINSMHAMKEGQQDSYVEVSTSNLTISREQALEYDLSPGDYIRLSVKDNGRGVEKSILDRIFEPFFTTRDEGNGLGLSQVYSFVKRSSGSILVNSILDEGTEFSLFFPRDISTSRSSEKHKISDPYNRKGDETILVVDDERPLRDLSAAILKQEGYQVLQASNGVDALSVLEENKVDLVVSDIVMPVMDGHLLAKKIKLQYPHIKIQLVSGYIDPKSLPNTNDELYNNLLNKPVETTELLKRVRCLLNENLELHHQTST